MRKPKDAVEQAMATALKIANTFRRSIGEKEVDGMVAGLASDATECILARTFNASCYVGYDNEGVPPPEFSEEYDDEVIEPPDSFFGYAAFKNEDTAKAFAEAINEHDRTAEAEAKHVDSNPQHQWRVELPTPVAQIAFDFDQHQLDEDFYAANGSTFTTIPITLSA